MNYSLWIGAASEKHAFEMLAKAEKGYVLTNYRGKWTVILRWKEKPPEAVLNSLCN